MKAAPTVTFSNHLLRPYMVRVSFSRNPELFRMLCAEVPGFGSAGRDMCTGPTEMLNQISDIFRGCGYVVRDQRTQVDRKKLPMLPPRIGYPHQKEGARRLLANGTYLLPFEMGTGKTLAAIIAMRAARPLCALVICPAGVRSVWQDELRKWWPRASRPAVTCIETGRMAAAWSPSEQREIVLISYELLEKLKFAGAFSFVVADEMHYVSDARRKRSGAVRRVLGSARIDYKLGLTGTPVTNDIKGLWHQLECLWPGRFGTFWTFVQRYAIVEENQHTKWHIHGINREHAAELAERLDYCCYRVTASDVAHLMPAFSAQSIRVRPGSSKKSKAALAEFARTGKVPEGFLSDFAMPKIAEAVRFAEDAVAQGKRVVVLTHLHETGETIAAKLCWLNWFPVWHFDGRQSVKVREKVIQTALREPNPGVLVCTMHSVKEGINTLANFDAAIIVELYYTPGVMVQVIKRFHRISGSCNVKILCIEGSHEEVVAERLREKIENSALVLQKGHAESTLDETLSIDEDEELAGLRAAAAELVDEDFSLALEDDDE